MTKLMSPEYHADLARAAEAEGKFAKAADEWRNAKACTIGHKRADRYYENMIRCQKIAEEQIK